MAKKKRNEVLVGATVLISLILAVYIIITLGDWENLFTRKNNIRFEMPYQVGLKGLTQGSPVMLGGAKVGQVDHTAIRMASDTQAEGANAILVSFTIEVPAAYPLRSDCRLSAQSNVLGGQAVLIIEELGRQGHLLTNDETVPLTTLSGGFTDVMNNINKEFNSSDPQSLLFRIKAELDNTNPDSLLTHLLQTTTNVESITQALDDELAMLPDQSTLRSQLRTLLDSLQSTIAQVHQFMEANRQPLTHAIASMESITRELEKRTPELVANVQKTLNSAAESLTEIRELAAVLRTEVDMNKEFIDRIILNLNEMSVNLTEVSRAVRRAPWKLLYKPTGSEIKYQALIDSTENFVGGAERLDALAIHLKVLLQETPTPENQQRIEAMMKELERTFQTYKEAEEQFWEVLK